MRTRALPGPDGRVLTHVRLPDELLRRLDHFCVERNISRPVAHERLLGAALTAVETQAEKRRRTG